MLRAERFARRRVHSRSAESADDKGDLSALNQSGGGVRHYKSVRERLRGKRAKNKRTGHERSTGKKTKSKKKEKKKAEFSPPPGAGLRRKRCSGKEWRESRSFEHRREQVVLATNFVPIC